MTDVAGSSTPFPPEVVDAVLAHMNDDHGDDSLLIVQAFGAPHAVAATMNAVDGEAGTWVVTDEDGVSEELRIIWPGGPLTERAEIRREVVVLYDEACRSLGREPRPH